MGGQLESASSRGSNRVRFDGPIEPQGRHLEAAFLEEIFSQVWRIGGGWAMQISRATRKATGSQF